MIDPERIDRLLDRAEALLELMHTMQRESAVDRNDANKPPPAAFYRWQLGKGLILLRRALHYALDDLLFCESQKEQLINNTRQFVLGAPANHALLWGAKGTGKSSLARAVSILFIEQNLCLVDLPHEALVALPEVVETLYEHALGNAQRYIIYCDDLSFQQNTQDFKSVKRTLEGSLIDLPENILVYATSNRRHLIPEPQTENQPSALEIHPEEAIEERLSLSERFGLWLAFHPFNEEQYLAAVTHWLQQLARINMSQSLAQTALQWARERGSLSGRVARQFANHIGGAHVARQRSANAS